MAFVPLNMTAPAKGDVLYYDGTNIVNLGPGTAGQVLATGGANAAPAWADASQTVGAVILAPASTTRNTIQPSADANVGLVLKRKSGSQSGAMLAVTDESNGPLLTIAGNGRDIVLDTTTGTKLGTVGGAAGQKLGFLGATPIVQPVLATGGGATVDQVITALQNLGLLRNS